MLAMQYTMTLPADYDMRVIRERVRRAGHALDDRAGLALKAYLIRERGVEGSRVNQYAPFYVWNEPAAMTHFLIGGGGFQNIVRDFGRPPVAQWTGVAAVRGGAAGAPTAAVRQLVALPQPAEGDAPVAIDDALAALHALEGHPDLHTAALAYDPRDWQLLRFTLWHHRVPADQPAGERYEVLHLSAPELDRLTR
ncbi:DUF4865 family protein [Dactylosporangium aurantiacum]|uniref:DUF4865 family protein n=1 Tax=Dactylosporangium aurantiacum TaxID=35754 RepID=A0A9Q9MJX7_9ACTN|nr:DUF4865 family protein [Dactylosporangium aurantiacum]MDG6108437.1 DUF4865 family protein [Dactylosporangium aurantiacum]UWZ57370.1 DUF4865 family protein [Dactylosporangium aurantiacum]